MAEGCRAGPLTTYLVRIGSVLDLAASYTHSTCVASTEHTFTVRCEGMGSARPLDAGSVLRLRGTDDAGKAAARRLVTMRMKQAKGRTPCATCRASLQGTANSYGVPVSVDFWYLDGSSDPGPMAGYDDGRYRMTFRPH
jgi:hypothetical protein